MSSVVSSTPSTFVPQIPDFTESFFEPERIDDTESSSYPSAHTQALFEAEHPINLSMAKTPYSPEQLQLYRQFLSECLSHKYEPSPYGTICPAHPEALHPYPGPMPENPHQDKKVFTQFVQRGLSKKFREQERDFKNDFRHWQAQMKEHLAEVPKLKAKDALFKGFVAFVQANYRDAHLDAQEALKHNSYLPIGYALLAVSAYEQGEVQQGQKHEEKLKKLLPSMPLGEFGHRLINQMVQDNLSKLYVQTCKDASIELAKHTGAIPLEKNYLADQIQRSLWNNLQNAKSKGPIDYLDLTWLYFLQETLFEDASKNLSSFMDDSFSYMSQLFEHLSVNLDLIKAHSINISESLQSVIQSESLTKEQLGILIEELSKPLSHGDPKLKRTFLHHAMHIQLFKKLFEINASQINSD